MSANTRLVKKLWRVATGDRDRYLALLREHGYIYERPDGATVHTVDNPVDGRRSLFGAA